MDWLLNLEVDHRGFVSEADRDEFFRQQFKLPENTTCFECGFNNPKWTSVSFSIYLCLNCSGKHRQLGSHISFVRSVDMDRFTRDQLVRLSLGGNKEFTAFLTSENLFKKPMNYDNKKVLSYTSRLDAELAKYTGKKPQENPSPTRDNMLFNSENTEQNFPNSVSDRSDSLSSGKNTESCPSSLRDDVESLSKSRTDVFGDLIDFVSTSSDDVRPKVTCTKQNDEPCNVDNPTNSNLDLFDTFEQPPSQENTFKFDSFSDFLNTDTAPLNQTNTTESLLSLDFTSAPSPSRTTAPTLSGTSAASVKTFSSSTMAQNQKDSTFTPSRNPANLQRHPSRSKFSSKANNFDFEKFEKQNTLQSSFNTVSSQSKITSNSFGPSTTPVPGDSSRDLAPPPPPTPSRLVGSPVSTKGSGSSAFSSVPLDTQNFGLKMTGTNTLGETTSVFNKDVSGSNFPGKPDLSQFEGKKSISSDAYFGTLSPKCHSPIQVSANSQAFSSDDYFGRPKQEQHHAPTIEEQAIQNINELKENIVNALNKGGVLLEKAKQWLYTNYY